MPRLAKIYAACHDAETARMMSLTEEQRTMGGVGTMRALSRGGRSGYSRADAGAGHPPPDTDPP